jgi:DNA-binding MarR family transcriptional regulator
MTVSEVAHELQLVPTRVSLLVRELVDRDVVVRRIDNHDRR